MLLKFDNRLNNVKAAMVFALVAFVILMIFGFIKQQEIVLNQSIQHKIKITISGNEITATLNDSKTSRDFISILPLELTLEDYASTEKIVICPNG